MTFELLGWNCRRTLTCGWVVSCLILGGLLLSGSAQQLRAQDEKAEQEMSGIRVRGQLVVESTKLEIDLSGIEMTLEEIVPAPKLPLPENFESLSIEQRQKWYQEFQASDAGKKYQAEFDKIDAARRKFSATSDAEGKFAFEGTFPGSFGLFGQKEITVDNKTYFADFFAEVPVGEGVKFMDLGTMPLQIRRVLKAGDAAPDLVLESKGDGQPDETVSMKSLAGSPVLLCFFTLDSLPRVREEIDAVVAENTAQVQVLGVNLDPVSETRSQQLEALNLKWKVHTSSGLESAPAVVDYGILALPGFCLIDARGQVLLTDEAFYEAMGQEGSTMRSVISAAVGTPK